VVLEITCRKVQNAIVKLERRRDLIIPGVFPGPEPPATAGWQNPKTNQHSKTTGPAGPRDHLSRRDSVAKRSKDRTQQAAIRRGGRSKNKVKNTGRMTMDQHGPTNGLLSLPCWATLEGLTMLSNRCPEKGTRNRDQSEESTSRPAGGRI